MENSSFERARLNAEARLLFTLVDAFFLEHPQVGHELTRKWGSIQASAAADCYEHSAPDCLAILVELERRGDLRPSWIRAQLDRLRHRIVADVSNA